MFKFIIVLCIVGFPSTHSEYCNPISCFLHISQLIYGGETQDICMKLPKVIHCIESCSLSSNNTYLKGLRNVQSNVCDSHSEVKDGILSHNKCIDRHKYRMFACLYEASALSNEKEPDQKRVYCRKILESLYCTKKIISSPCGEDASIMLEDILVDYFKPVREEVCSYSYQTIWDLEVKSNVDLNNGYKKLAKCFDRHLTEVLSCVNEKWTTNFLMNDNHKSGLCREVQSMINCILQSIRQECDDEMADTFSVLANNLNRDLVPYCVEIFSSTLHPALVPHQLVEDKPINHSNEELVHNVTTESSLLQHQSHVIVVYNVGRSECGAFSQPINLLCIISFLLVFIYVLRHV